MPPSEPAIPDEYHRLSDAVDLLERRMWGGLPTPFAPMSVSAPEELAKRLKRNQRAKRSPFSWEPHTREAIKLVVEALKTGSLNLYCLYQTSNGDNWAVHAQPMPQELVLLLPRSRLGLPMPMPGRLFEPKISNQGSLVPQLSTKDRTWCSIAARSYHIVKKDEFRIWMESERRKYSWPSQMTHYNLPLKNKRGRPRKRDSIRDFIRKIIGEGKFSSNDFSKGDAMRLKRLVEAAKGSPISQKTFARAVEDYHISTGDPRLGKFRRVHTPRRG